MDLNKEIKRIDIYEWVQKGDCEAFAEAFQWRLIKLLKTNQFIDYSVPSYS